VVAAILLATLTPNPSAESGGWVSCFVCGDRGLADILVNIILFVPFGAALGAGSMAWWQIWIVGTAFSAALEYAQLFIPGRDSSLADVCTNSLGALVGGLVVRLFLRACRRLQPPSLLEAGAASMFAVATITATGLLLRPAFPPTTYWGQWTPALGHLAWYHGRVLRASLGDVFVPPTQLSASSRVRALLEAGAPLNVLALAGPPVPKLASLFSIADDQSAEIVFLGPDRGAWVFRSRTRAAAWDLDQPDLRVRGPVEGVRVGDTLDISVRHREHDVCVTVGRATRCGLGFTAGRGWAMLEYPRSWPDWLRALLDAVWLLGLWAPAGFYGWSRWGRLIVIGCAIGALGVLAPALGLLPTPPREWIGAAIGLVIGAASRAAFFRPPTGVAGVQQGALG